MGSTSRSSVESRPGAARPCAAIAVAVALAVALACARPTVPGDATPLRVGTSGDYASESLWPPDQAEPTGFSVDVARAFARAQGRSIEWVRFRWPTLEADLVAGRFDLALSGITVRPDRSLAGRFSLPLAASGAVVLVPATSPITTAGELARPGLRIAVNAGGHLERVARALLPAARIEAVADNAEVPRRLAAGACDAVMTDSQEADHWRAVLPGARPIGPLTRDTKAAWLPIGREALVHALDAWLLEAEASGELARLRARHGQADETTASPSAAILARLDERLALMPAVAEAKRALGLAVFDRDQEERVHDAARATVRAAAAARGREAPSDAALARFVAAMLGASRHVQELADSRSTPANDVAGEAGAEAAAAARHALDGRIRPAIGFVTERLLWLVVEARPATTPPTREAVARALADHALPIAHVHALADALADLLLEPTRGAERVVEREIRADRPARGASRAPRAAAERTDTRPSA